MGYMLLSGIMNKDDALKVGDAALLALIGIAIVFVVLILLMLIVQLEGKIFEGSEKLREKHPEWNEKIQNAKQKMAFWKKKEQKQEDDTQVEEKQYAQGTCGELKLINTDERDAAMIMAIVADETNTPLNELRFKSIKRVEEEK